MQKVYSHPDVGMVQLAKNALAQRGIDAVVRGEHLAGVIGGGAGIEAWVELWVADEAQAQRAARIVQETLAEATAESGEPWKCPVCGEAVEAQFAVCWNCGHEAPAFPV